MPSGHRSTTLFSKALSAIAVAMVHRPGEDAMAFLLLALTMAAMSTASAATMTALASLASLTLLPSGSTVPTWPSGRTSATTAPSAFTSPGTSGGVVRSNIHVTLFFVFTRLRVNFIQVLGSALPMESSDPARPARMGSRAAAGFFLIFSRPSGA